MDLNKLSMKKIRELIIFTVLLVVALWKFEVVIDVLKTIGGIIFPFVLGGAIAFVINVPMSFLEKKIFGKAKEENKAGKKLARPVSLLLTIILAVGVVVLVMFGVIPQLTRTIASLMISIANFIPQMQDWIREFSHNNQDIMKLVNQVQFNPDQAIKWGISILGSGAGNMMNTTMSAVGSIVSGFATFFIAFSFCMLHSFSERKTVCTDKKSIFCIYSETKSRGISENLFSDLSNICKFPYRAVCRSCDSRKYVCCYTQYFKNAICTFDRNFNCIYCIDSDLWSFYRMCSGLLFDFYGKS